MTIVKTTMNNRRKTDLSFLFRFLYLSKIFILILISSYLFSNKEFIFLSNVKILFNISS
jgi:hypothetical protein